MRHTLVALLGLACAGSAFAQVALTKHNLSVSGPGGVKAVSETQICIFCHTPHNSSPQAQLWNRPPNNTGATAYVPYSSSTALARAGQPNGASLLCLSCHDGTIALGNVLSRSSPISMAGGVTTMPTNSPSYIGTDLSDDHPVSIIYSDILVAARGELASPTTLTGRVRLDSFGQVQCTSCHDPHSDTYGKFLVMANQGSALCIACHVKNFWTQTSHNLSVATWNGSDPNPWPHTSGSTVAANGCENCHRPHTAGGRQWLMNYLAEENNCYSCHNGNVAQKDVQTEFLKYSHHPVETNVGVHDASRAVEPVVLPGNQRHVECVDCHNPHATNGSTGALPGSLLGVRGVDRFGNELGLAPFPPVTYEYQICFRCHADSSGQPAPRTNRQIAQSNLRLSMASGNPSYHPVLAPGVNTNVPSLLAPWTTASVMKCGDCHNNDTGPGAGDIGPTGPHGSNNPSLLERGYSTLDGTPYTYNAYALCFKCHDFLRFITTVVGAPFGSITGHAGHVVGQRTPCNVCHDPHGVSATQGNAINNSKLMNFDISVVSSVLINGVPTLKYEATTPGHGRCYLVCHGNIHNPRTY